MASGRPRPARRRTTAQPRQAATPAVVARAGAAVASVTGITGETAASKPIELEALVVSHWFTAESGTEPYSATVRYTGRLVSGDGKAVPGATFEHHETIEGIAPDTGPVSITATIYGLEPGRWNVDAEIARRPTGPSWLTPHPGTRRATHQYLPRGRWSWRHWRLDDAESTPLSTRMALVAPLAALPAVIPGIYTALAVAGIAIAVVLQAILLVPRIGGAQTVAVSLTAILAGLIGAKVWYAFLHPKESMIRGGWAVDGFLVVAPVVAALVLFAQRLPIGLYLDAMAPGMFLAVAIGRVGCFLTGCCAGRCTSSRWGIWSSDRRVGARRIPTQLVESMVGLALGVVAFVLVVANLPLIHGLIFVAAFAVYAAFRQLLLRLRVEQRTFTATLPATAVAAGIVALVLGTLSAAQGI